MTIDREVRGSNPASHSDKCHWGAKDCGSILKNFTSYTEMRHPLALSHATLLAEYMGNIFSLTKELTAPLTRVTRPTISTVRQYEKFKEHKTRPAIHCISSRLNFPVFNVIIGPLIRVDIHKRPNFPHVKSSWTFTLRTFLMFTFLLRIKILF